MADVVMPRLSDSMEEGTIIRWLKGEGEPVSPGEELVEIETDKATVTYESEVSGLLRIIATAGQTLAVGAIIGEIDGGAPAAADGASRVARADPSPTVAHADPSPTVAQAGSPPTVARTDSAPARRLSASPVARRLAHELGVDLEQVHGTGPGGRISKSDVEAASRAPRAAPAEAPARSSKGDVEVREPTRIQATIARRMAEAKATIPEFTLTTEVDMDAVVRLRADLSDAGPPIRVPSLNDFVVKACALALRNHPRVNASYRDGSFELYGRVNIGVAVATEDALLVPVVFDADARSLGQIAADTRALAERARAGKLAPPELAGGTFTISNLGMYGITEFVAVINPPQAAILAVGSLEDRVVLRDGTATSSNRMKLTLSCDHRILYGADAAAFLRDVRANLEQPLRLAL